VRPRHVADSMRFFKDERSGDGHSAILLIDPTGLVPVVNEVEWLRQQRPISTFASTDTRSAGGGQTEPIDPTSLAPVVK
jgi:hypothetical protein